MKVYTFKEQQKFITDSLTKSSDFTKAKTKLFGKKITDAFNKFLRKAKDIINDDEKVEHFLDVFEEKLKLIPKFGNDLAYVPRMISLVRSFIKKEYKDAPVASVISIVAAVIYFVSPIDAIPDVIPVLGYADDVAVIALVWKMVKSDVDDYERWKHGEV